MHLYNLALFNCTKSLTPGFAALYCVHAEKFADAWSETSHEISDAHRTWGKEGCYHTARDDKAGPPSSSTSIYRLQVNLSLASCWLSPSMDGWWVQERRRRTKKKKKKKETTMTTTRMRGTDSEGMMARRVHANGPWQAPPPPPPWSFSQQGRQMDTWRDTTAIVFREAMVYHSFRAEESGEIYLRSSELDTGSPDFKQD